MNYLLIFRIGPQILCIFLPPFISQGCRGWVIQQHMRGNERLSFGQMLHCRWRVSKALFPSHRDTWPLPILGSEERWQVLKLCNDLVVVCDQYIIYPQSIWEINCRQRQGVSCSEVGANTGTRPGWALSIAVSSIRQKIKYSSLQMLLFT